MHYLEQKTKHEDKIMFDKLLAKVGIGSAKVDTVLKNMTLMQGDIVEGVVHIQGGKVDQDINNITISVRTRAKAERESDGEKETYHINMDIGKIQVNQPMKVEAKQKYEIPFSIQLPSETPITAITTKKNETKVWIHTELDIEWGVDSDDRDYLTVLPHPAVEMMINKFLEKGFQVQKVDVEKGYLSTPSFSSSSGVYQEIELRPASAGIFSWATRTINEVELSFILEGDTVHLLVEIDRSFSGDGYASVSYPASVQEDEIEEYFGRVFG